MTDPDPDLSPHDLAVAQAIEKVGETLAAHQSCGRCTHMHVIASLIAGAVVSESMNEMQFVLYVETVKRMAVARLQTSDAVKATDDLITRALAEAHRKTRH